MQSYPDTDKLAIEYNKASVVADSLRAGGHRRSELQEAARIELGLRHFLEDGASPRSQTHSRTYMA